MQPFTTTPLDIDWTDWIATPPDKHTQKRILREAYSTYHTHLLSKLTPEQQAITRSAGGKGAAAWLYPPKDATTHMSSHHYLTALRYRTHTPITSRTGNTKCQHKNNTRTCQYTFDQHAHHAVTCAIGGYTNTKHNHLRDVLYHWLCSMGYTCHREQHIPELDDTDEAGNHRQGIMDIVCHTTTGLALIDISVTDAVSACPKHNASHARHDGTAATAREHDKRRRYHDHPDLVPFVFETAGRWGTTAEAWLKTVAPTDPQERAETLTQLRYNLSTTLQRNVADAILTAYN